jgi:ribosomal protein L11 methyltransferase
LKPDGRTVSQPSTVARLATDEATARRIADLLGETLDPDETVTALVEQPEGEWGIEVYFSQPPDEASLRALVAQASGERAAPALTFSTLAERDWVGASLAGLKPVTAGRFVVHGQHDRARVRPNQVAIEIEAALAFGTGHHGTTRGCLLALDALAKRDKRQPSHILDLGTGSGVLAIAVAKAMRQPVLASDIDRVAVAAAQENARRNGAGPVMTVVHAAGLTARRIRAHAPYRLVFANILLAPLKQLARPMAMIIAPGGRAVLSGLLPQHANAALAAYRLQGLALERRLTIENWTTLIVARPSLRP